MVSLSNNTQGNVNITTRNGAGVNISSNNDTDISANMNGNSQRAKSWAVGEGLIDGVDYSAKHYAQDAKESAEQASGGVEAITEAKEQALSAIDTEKTEAIADMETAKEEKISEIEETAAGFEDDLEALTTRAETAATNAETSETNAAASATSASTSATNASNSATSATASASTASNAASRAETYRNQANQYRDDAQNYARQASGSANTASSKAEVAKSYAQDAATASGRAEQAKNAAEGYAQQAEQAKDDIEAELENYVPNTRKVNNKPLSADITLTSSDVGALANGTKYGYSIDLSLNTTNYKLTLTLKDQDGTALNTKTVDFPIESVVVNGSYDSTNKKIVLTLQNGTTIDIPVGDLISGLQTEITSTNKLDSDLVDDTNSSHKFATAAQLSQIATNTSSISNLATVATSGDYDDLTNKPTIPAAQVNSDWNASNGIAQILNKPSLATVATSGSYNDLSNKPTIPAAQVQADWNVTDTTSKAYIKNKPTIPSGVVVDQTYTPTSQNAQSGVAIAGVLPYFVQKNVGNTYITNDGTQIDCHYEDDDYFSDLYIDSSSAQLYYENYNSGDNSSVQANTNGVLLAYTSGNGNGVEIRDDSNNNITLTVSNNNLAVNGSEVALKSDLSTKQDTLVSGTNIKTINSTSLLGSGNIAVQPTLVSGTNIKTINNTSLLGSGNIDTSEIFIAEYDVTSYLDVRDAIVNSRVVFCKYGSSLYLFHSITGGSSGEATFFGAGNLGYIDTITLSANNIWSSKREFYADTDLSNLSATGKTVIDGQWVLGLNYTLSSATAIGTYTCDLTSYLPSGNDKYEVLLDCQILATNNAYVGIKDSTYDNYAFCATGGGRPARNIIVIALTGKTFKYDIAGAALSSGYIRLRGYRRIGTNT